MIIIVNYYERAFTLSHYVNISKSIKYSLMKELGFLSNLYFAKMYPAVILLFDL